MLGLVCKVWVSRFGSVGLVWFGLVWFGWFGLVGFCLVGLVWLIQIDGFAFLGFACQVQSVRLGFACLKVSSYFSLSS